MTKSLTLRRGVKAAASLFALALAAQSSNASAQMIGPCPSFIMPPPCIIFDYERLAQGAKEYAQQYERLKDMAEQVQQAKSNALSIGQTLDGFSAQPDAQYWSDSDVWTGVRGNDYAAVAQGFATNMYGGGGMSLNEMGNSIDRRRKEDFAANADAFAVSVYARDLREDLAGRMKTLGEAASSATNLREDMIANSQIRLEITRQMALKNQLMGSLLHVTSVDAAMNSNVDQPATVAKVSRLAAADPQSRNAGWDLLDQLRKKEAEIRSALSLLAFASGVETVESDIAEIISRHENAEQTKAQTYAALQKGAYSWSNKSGARILSTTISALSNIDNQMAALRAKPISELSGAFRERNIDVAEMTAAGIDPRQFIGTFADPLKGEWTLNMTNALLDGPLDDSIDGDENDEYRLAVMNFNNARLEEAWLETHAIEAGVLKEQTRTMVQGEVDAAGFEVTPDNVEARLRQLVGEGNAIAQQIQAAGDEAATRQASNVMTSINGLLNGG